MNSLICVIHGREALPVRAIPYVAGRTFLSPDEVAKQLARKIGPPFSRLQNTTAFHVARDLPVNVLPREWDEIIAQFEALEARLKRVQSSDAEGYAEWLEQATPLLPPAVFVWRDEFEKDFHLDRENISSAVPRDVDAVLNLSPMLSEPQRAMILEGEVFILRDIHSTTTMDRNAFEEYKSRRNDRLSKGRYTLEEAAMLIAEKTGERADGMLEKLKSAARSRQLDMYEPGKKAMYNYGEGGAKQVRTFYEEAYWNDLNTWLSKYEPRIYPAGLMFLEPAEQINAPSAEGDDDGLKKREKQIRAIETVAKELGFDPLLIPDGGKKKVGSICKQKHANVFGAGEDPFKEAWQEAVDQNRIRMANHEKFSNR